MTFFLRGTQPHDYFCYWYLNFVISWFGAFSLLKFVMLLNNGNMFIFLNLSKLTAREVRDVLSCLAS